MGNTSSPSLTGHSDSINYMHISDNLRLRASASCDKTVKLWEIRSGECRRTFVGHKDCVSGVMFLPGSEQLLSASCDKTIKIWNVESGECLQTLEGHQDRVNFVLFLPDTNQLFSASCDKSIRLWDLKTGLDRYESFIITMLRGDNEELEHGQWGVRVDLRMPSDMRQLPGLLGQLGISRAKIS